MANRRQLYNFINHNEWRKCDYDLPTDCCVAECQVKDIVSQMIRAVRSPSRDNDEIKNRFRGVLDVFFECPRGQCSRQLLRLFKKIALDIAELPPACEAIPLPRPDGRESGFSVVAVANMRIG